MNTLPIPFAYQLASPGGQGVMSVPSREGAEKPGRRSHDQHKTPKSDIEISQAAAMRPILEVAADKLDIPAEDLIPYGHYKAKVALDYIASLAKRPDGKLILVTAITPTPAGEGKTTTTVGLGDALNEIGKKAMICIREPSLGPCFGMKGGAAGGGYAQVVPMEDINLHFTGDFHAIGAANNLLAAMIDNHVYWGNALDIDTRRVTWRRAVDMNDRALRSDRHLARRRRQRLPARGRLRHHRRLRGHGDLLSRLRPRRPPAAPGPNPDRPDARQEGGHRQGPVGGGLDGRAAQGRARAEPGADAREQPGLHSWRPVRQYRPWLQLGDRHQGGAQARRLRGHRSRLRRRSRRREILRHQMPQSRAQARLRGDRRHHQGAQDAWRRGQGRSQEGESRGAGEGLRQSRAPRRECAQISRAGGGGGRTASPATARPRSRCSSGCARPSAPNA